MKWIHKDIDYFVGQMN